MNNLAKYSFLLLLSYSAFSQTSAAVNQVAGTPPNMVSSLFFYNGSSELIYDCVSPSVASRPAKVFSVANGLLTNIAVSSNVATITFSGTSQMWQKQFLTVGGSATAALNGTYSVQTVSGSTITINTIGVADGTYADTTLSVSVPGPLMNETFWSIRSLAYSGSNVITDTWAGVPSGFNVPGNLACSDRAKY